MREKKYPQQKSMKEFIAPEFANTKSNPIKKICWKLGQHQKERFHRAKNWNWHETHCEKSKFGNIQFENWFGFNFQFIWKEIRLISKSNYMMGNMWTEWLGQSKPRTAFSYWTWRIRCKLFFSFNSNEQPPHSRSAIAEIWCELKYTRTL